MYGIDKLVETFKIGLLKNYNGTDDDYTSRLKQMCVDAGNIAVQKYIIFTSRLAHRKRCDDKKAKKKRFNKYYEEIDDTAAKNGQYWKELRARFFYHYKDVK